MVRSPGEAEAGSAGEQPAEEYSGRSVEVTWGRGPAATARSRRSRVMIHVMRESGPRVIRGNQRRGDSGPRFLMFFLRVRPAVGLSTTALTTQVKRTQFRDSAGRPTVSLYIMTSEPIRAANFATTSGASRDSSRTAKNVCLAFRHNFRSIWLCRSCFVRATRGDLILDPFSGSGTSWVGAVENSRQFIGIECSRSFAKSSETRIANARA
jgi:hypothetical protein